MTSRDQKGAAPRAKHQSLSSFSRARCTRRERDELRCTGRMHAWTLTAPQSRFQDSACAAKINASKAREGTRKTMDPTDSDAGQGLAAGSTARTGTGAPPLPNSLTFRKLASRSPIVQVKCARQSPLLGLSISSLSLSLSEPWIFGRLQAKNGRSASVRTSRTPSWTAVIASRQDCTHCHKTLSESRQRRHTAQAVYKSMSSRSVATRPSRLDDCKTPTLMV